MKRLDRRNQSWEFVNTFTFTILILICIEYREDNFVIPSTLHLGCKCCYKVLQEKHGLCETEAGYEYDECIERLESRIVVELFSKHVRYESGF